MIKNKSLMALLILTGLCLLCSSCDRFTNWKKVTWDHYATGFYLESSLAIEERSSDDCIEIRAKGWNYQFRQFWTTPNGSFVDINNLFYNPELRPQLEQIIQDFGEAKHQAHTYEGYTQPNFDFRTPSRCFFKTPIDKVELVSDRDWGDQPAGSVLNAHFWLLGRCHDRYAKHLDNPGRQRMPADFHVRSEAYMKLVAQAYDRTGEEDWDLRDGLYEVILSPLDRVDFSSMDYLEPQLFLTSDSPHFAEPQTLTIRTTFRDGTVTTLTSEINKPK